MDDKLASLPETVVVEIVKLAQKQGRAGSSGTWKQFLNFYDKKIGSSLSDPAKRPRHALVSFLHSFTNKSDLKFVDNVIRLHSNREALNKVRNESPDDESPEQRLVRLTVEHPFYLSKYAFPSFDQEWVVTKLPKQSKLISTNSAIGIDCEMVLCGDGTEALVRVCVVDRDLQVKLDEKVNPYKPVADYRTEITGIAAKDLDGVSCSLQDVQKSMKKLLRKGTILVGHGLYNDLQALKIDHSRVVDTSFIFRRLDGRPPSLDTLCKSVLGFELRKGGAPHNCLDDARATMQLFLAKIKCGVDNDNPVNQDDVLETELAKLLLHRIPTNVQSEELRGVFPEQFTVELKPFRKAGVQYSAFAVFKNAWEANQAFENLQGRAEKDKNGLLQKMIMLKLKTGRTTNLYVRKMGNDHWQHGNLEKKRPFEGEDIGERKKLKTDDCEGHLKEIERLKQELKEKDLNKCNNHIEEIERLNKALSVKDNEISKLYDIVSSLKNKMEGLKSKKK